MVRHFTPRAVPREKVVRLWSYLLNMFRRQCCYIGLHVVCISWLLKTVLLSLHAMPIFCWHKGSVTHFSELGLTPPVSRMS